LNTRRQLVIDNYVAKPLAWLLNFLVRGLGMLLRLDHRLDRPMRRIVVCKFKGLGSIIQASPMLAALKHRFPESEITFVTTPGNIAMLKKISDVDRIITVDDKSFLKLIPSLFRAMIRLIRLRADVYIDLEIYSNFSTLVTLFSLARNRIGFYLRSSSFRMGIYTHMMYFNTGMAIAEVYLQIARLFGPLEQPAGLFPLYRNVADEAGAKAPEEAYLVINPNASDLRLERRWAAENFAELIRRCLQQFPGMKILLVGSPSERPYTEQVVAQIASPRVLNMAGRTSMDELIMLIRRARLMITNDTGPMHIAFACDTPAICLFGPCAPEQYAWLGNATILYKRVFCSPCVHEFSQPPCGGNNTCMQLITVDEVMSAVAGRLKDAESPHCLTHHPQVFLYGRQQEVLGLVIRG
jgi:ADP-heptose:LPS heptosyltransferase